MHIVFSGTKLGTKFNNKDKTSKGEQHGLTYSVVCLDANCNKEYNGETGRQLIKGFTNTVPRTLVNSHVFKH